MTIITIGTNLLTLKDLQEVFSYDEESGNCVDLRTNTKIISQVQGRNPYLVFFWNGNTYYVHKLIVYIKTGRYPERQSVDHIDGNVINNAWKNLRLATPSQNSWNRKKPITNSSGVKGLYLRQKEQGWQIRLVVNKKIVSKFYSWRVHGGEDSCREYAVKQLETLRDKHHGEFANHG